MWAGRALRSSDFPGSPVAVSRRRGWAKQFFTAIDADHKAARDSPGCLLCVLMFMHIGRLLCDVEARQGHLLSVSRARALPGWQRLDLDDVGHGEPGPSRQSVLVLTDGACCPTQLRQAPLLSCALGPTEAGAGDPTAVATMSAVASRRTVKKLSSGSDQLRGVGERLNSWGCRHPCRAGNNHPGPGCPSCRATGTGD